MEAILTFSLVMMVFAATDNFHAATTAHLPVSPCMTDPDTAALTAVLRTLLNAHVGSNAVQRCQSHLYRGSDHDGLGCY